MNSDSPVEGKAGGQPSRPMAKSKLKSLAVVFFVSCAIALRAIALSPDGLEPVAFYLRLGAPLLLVFVTAVIAAEFAVNKRAPVLLRISSRSRRVVATTYCFTLVVCAFDVLAGIEPYLLVPGMVVYSYVIWDRPGFLAISSGLGALAMLWLGVAIGKPIGLADVFVLSLGVALPLYGASVIKKNVLPSEELLKSLQAENEELWNLSFKDTLTGLYNRRYIQQIAIHLFSRAVRYKEQLHVLMIDIDHFKRVNDKLGHSVGDEVLKGVAQTILTTLRTSDTVARYGGEEFIVYMVRSDPETTQFIANRIRDGVAAVQFPEVPWTVTISIGVAGLQEGDSAESLVERADQFLYVSKHRGRNRVSGF